MHKLYRSTHTCMYTNNIQTTNLMRHYFIACMQLSRFMHSPPLPPLLYPWPQVSSKARWRNASSQFIITVCNASPKHNTPNLILNHTGYTIQHMETKTNQLWQYKNMLQCNTKNIIHIIKMFYTLTQHHMSKSAVVQVNTATRRTDQQHDCYYAL